MGDWGALRKNWAVMAKATFVTYLFKRPLSSILGKVDIDYLHSLLHYDAIKGSMRSHIVEYILFFAVIIFHILEAS